MSLGEGLGRAAAAALVAFLIIGLAVGGLMAIGIEHLAIYLWHHVHIHWSKP